MEAFKKQKTALEYVKGSRIISCFKKPVWQGNYIREINRLKEKEYVEMPKMRERI